MSKYNPNLMIPFYSQYGVLASQCSARYPSNPTIVWNVAEKKTEYKPREPYRYRETDEVWQIKIDKYNAEKAIFDAKIASGKFIEVLEYEWRLNMPWRDKLEYIGYSKYQSGVRFNFKSINTEIEYNMFISDFNDTMLLRGMDGKYLDGEFAFAKKGSYIAMIML